MQTQHAAAAGNGADTWLRINQLLATRRHDILAREDGNRQCIYLYDMGAYRVAFEQSAWQLCRLFPSSTTAAIEADAYPFTIVTAFVPDTDVRQYCRRHNIETYDDHTVLATGNRPAPEQYRRWKGGIIDDLR